MMIEQPDCKNYLSEMFSNVVRKNERFVAKEKLFTRSFLRNIKNKKLGFVLRFLASLLFTVVA